MTTVSLKLPKRLATLLEKESRTRQTSKSSVVRECLEKQLLNQEEPRQNDLTTPGESFYADALPILKKAWTRNRKLPRDLSTNPKYMEDFGE